jgi:hypothetical protein
MSDDPALNTYDDAMERLVELGLVERTPDGEYQLTQEGRRSWRESAEEARERGIGRARDGEGRVVE